MESFGILLGSAHSHIEATVRVALAPRNEFSFWGRAASGAEVIAQCRVTVPDLILLDVDLPDISSVSLIRFVAHRFPGTRVIGFSASEDVSAIRDMLNAGAQGYLLYTDPPHDLPAALHAALAGRSVFSPHVVTLLLTN